VLEVGCGRGVGVEVLLDRLDVAHVTAFDLDPAMVELAERRLHGRPAGVVSLFTDHPRLDRFEADEFADEVAHHGLHGTGRLERHLGELVFVGAAHKGR
jgi:SAM-dependent methyltransferase